MSDRPVFKSPAGQEAIIAAYDAILHRWPQPFDAFHLPTRHGSTFVLASGDIAAPALILLHGSSTNSAMWLGDVAVFTRSHRVYAVDLLGEPGKSDAVRPALTGSACAEWLADLYEGLHLDCASLAGVSLGGWMALKFATSQPDRVNKLVLLCPSGVAPAKISFILKAMLYLPLGQWGVDRLNRLVYGNHPIPAEAAAFGNLVMQHFNPRMESIPIFSDDELKRLTMPTLLIVGEQDALLPSTKTATRLQQLLPAIQVNMLPGAGHVLIGETEQIDNFLA